VIERMTAMSDPKLARLDGVARDRGKVPSRHRGPRDDQQAGRARPRSARIQARLRVGSVDDPQEREADRAADQIMRYLGSAPTAEGSEPARSDQRVQRASSALARDDEPVPWGPPVQRASWAIGRADAPAPSAPRAQRSSWAVTCDDEPTPWAPRVHRDSWAIARRAGQDHAAGPLIGPGGGALDAGTDSSIQSARGTGVPLQDGLRRSMERGFGVAFSAVRVHHDGQADELNRRIQADAFTSGSDIFFRQGGYRPSSPDGQRLVAHELAHVVQQGAASPLRRHDSDDGRGHHHDHDDLPGLGEPVGAAADVGSTGAGCLQRHASFEHLLLGQIDPQQLRLIPDQRAALNLHAQGQAVRVTGDGNGYHVLRQERERVRSWQARPPQALGAESWGLELVRIDSADGGSTICSTGEMNMLADYFGSVDELRAASAVTVHRLLQTERDEYYKELGRMLDEFMARDFVEKAEPNPNPLTRYWYPTVAVKYWLPEDAPFRENYTPADYTVREGDPRLTPQQFEGSQKYTGVKAETKNLITMVGLEALPAGTLMEATSGLLPRDVGLTNYYGEGKGTGTAWGVTARNACHFAPESWRSWESNHNRALDLADDAVTARLAAQVAETDEERQQLLTESDNLANEARLYNGFGDHYLQDSFASGHLVNKTLVMQWYTEEISTWSFNGPKGIAWVRMRQMADQANLASTNYSKARNVAAHNPQAAANKATAQEAWDLMGLSSIVVGDGAKALFAAMRASGWTGRYTAEDWAEVDPQGDPAFPAFGQVEACLTELHDHGLVATATEKQSGSNRPETVYSLVAHDLPVANANGTTGDRSMQTATANIYHEWLNNALVQAGAGALHDHFCKQGLWVSSEDHPHLFKLYGDDRLLTAGAGEGVQYAAETAQLSQGNVNAVLNEDRTRQQADAEVQNILNRLPSSVVPDFSPPANVYNAKEFGLDQFVPPATPPLQLAAWHNELKDYMTGRYLKTLFGQWAHHYAAQVGGDLTQFRLVSPHAGEDF
jgi:Domain of unknown function (DUF4157)